MGVPSPSLSPYLTLFRNDKRDKIQFYGGERSPVFGYPIFFPEGYEQGDRIGEPRRRPCFSGWELGNSPFFCFMLTPGRVVLIALFSGRYGSRNMSFVEGTWG